MNNELQKVEIQNIFGTTWIKLDSECIMKKNQKQ